MPLGGHAVGAKPAVGGGVTTYASDSFNRSDSATSLGTADVGGSWTAHNGTWGITSNKAYVASAVTAAHNMATLSIGQDNVSVSCDITLSATSNRAAAGIRLRHTNAAYWLGVYLFKTTPVNDQIILQQIVNGVYTPLATVTSAGLVNGATYNVKAVCTTTTVAVYLDGVSKISATAYDTANLLSQNYGITTYPDASYDDGGSRFDNFLVTS